jgi:hypothetical protein
MLTYRGGRYDVQEAQTVPGLVAQHFCFPFGRVNLLFRQCFPNVFLADPFWLSNITAEPHILAHVNMERPDDRYPKLQIFISELTLDSYKCMPLAYVTMRCMI